MTPNSIDIALWESVRADALGGITEFNTTAHLSRLPEPDTFLVTDDTQMSLYTMSAIFALFDQGLISTNMTHIPRPLWDDVRRVFAAHYITYLNDPDNHAGRAPGVTVISALDSLERYWTSSQAEIHGVKGTEGAKPYSKGCGSVMRTGWIGLLSIPSSLMIDLAVLSASVTHGHPTAQIMAALPPLIVSYPDPWTRPTNHHLMFEMVLEYIKDRFDLTMETEEYDLFTDRLSEDNINSYRALDLGTTDICSFFGEGWTADEAVSCALGALITACRAGYSSRTMIDRLILSSGDSDSIAMIGALYLTRFLNDVPEVDYKERIETRYKDELEELSQKISEFNQKSLYFPKNA